MFCDSCGTALLPNQTYCSSCGKQIRGGIHISYPRRGRVQEHIRLLGILWLALGAINTVGSLGILFAANFVYGHVFTPDNPWRYSTTNARLRICASIRAH